MESEKYIISKNNTGKMKRVWVEQKVRDTKPLLDLQTKVAEVNTNFRPESAESLHMTVAHFGIPEELFGDFQKVKPDLAFEQFMEGFYKLLESCDGAIKTDSEVQAEEFAVFGESPYLVAVVKILKTPLIMQVRQPISQALNKFIESLGISNVEQFMLGSPNLQFESDQVYQPHLTLGFIGENTTLPQTDVSALKISLKPSDIGNVVSK